MTTDQLAALRTSSATARVNIGSVTMPAGEYIVGDPCYSVPDGRWMEWLEAARYTEERRYLLADIDGHPVLGIGTAHGDGSYPGSDGNEYPVDAGLIGVVPVEVAETKGYVVPQSELTKRVTFAEPFECSYADGTITLGHIAIDTDGEEW